MLEKMGKNLQDDELKDYNESAADHEIRCTVKLKMKVSVLYLSAMNLTLIFVIPFLQKNCKFIQVMTGKRFFISFCSNS